MSINPQDSIPYDDAGNSFWDIGGYKPTVKRVTDGHQLCSDLMALVKERSDLEAKYADSLKRWSRTWANTIGKGRYVRQEIVYCIHDLHSHTLAC